MSKIFYKTLGDSQLKNIVKDVQTASSELGIDFFGVGALARNIWYVTNDENSRGTKDVDFGIYVPSSDKFNQLKKKLIGEFSYYPSSTNPFCLISPYGLPLDLLPFGEIEENGKVMIEGTGLVSINLEGFSETYSNGLVIANIEDDTIKVCSIPSVVLLKLIAFDDRPNNRPNDPIDIDSVLKHYPAIETEMIWGEYSFLYNDDISHEEVGIRVLGYEICKLISKNLKLTKRVLDILNRAINLESNLAERMIQDAEIETVKSKIENLSILKSGIELGINNSI